MRRSLVALLLAALVAVPIGASATLMRTPTPGQLLVGFDGEANPGLLRAMGGHVLRTLPDAGVIQVWTPDTARFAATLNRMNGVVFVESNGPLRLAGAYAGTTWDASSWDASSWDASSWDASSWDASSWDASSWDASSWDASSWDASSWDASSWDASSWDASSWDASSWDASSWDASSWDASSWDGGMDPGFPSQWGLGAANFLDAWRIERGQGRVGICVLDTGVDPSHPDLRPQLVRSNSGAYGYNAMLGGGSAFDDVGHGTHVIGIIAAASGNSTGVTGAAREPVLAVKVMDKNGGTEADLAAGIDVCAKSGARVISMSLHIDARSRTVERAIRSAQDDGLLLVAAAGNDGAASVRYPAAYSGVIAVGAVGPDAQAAPFSNGGSRLDLVAPGEKVVSTFLAGGYRSGSGTSQAVPFVAAAAALVWETDLGRSAEDVRDILIGSARDLGENGRDTRTGHGALDAGAALALAQAG